MTNKYLVTIEFRYLGTPKNDLDSVQNTKINIIGVFDTFETACIEGNKATEKLNDNNFIHLEKEFIHLEKESKEISEINKMLPKGLMVVVLIVKKI